jgi:hypothetical protein
MDRHRYFCSSASKVIGQRLAVGIDRVCSLGRESHHSPRLRRSLPLLSSGVRSVTAPIVSRQRLQNRRPHWLYRFESGGQFYTGGIGRFDDGRIAEIFINGAKVGSAAETNCGIDVSRKVAADQAVLDEEQRRASRDFDENMAAAAASRSQEPVIIQVPQAAPADPAPPRPLNCFTTRLGGGMSTTICR